MENGSIGVSGLSGDGPRVRHRPPLHHASTPFVHCRAASILQHSVPPAPLTPSLQSPQKKDGPEGPSRESARDRGAAQLPAAGATGMFPTAGYPARMSVIPWLTREACSEVFVVARADAQPTQIMLFDFTS